MGGYLSAFRSTATPASTSTPVHSDEQKEDAELPKEQGGEQTATAAETPRETKIEVSEPWFTHIREGRKPVEGRKASPTWTGVKVGDILAFHSPAVLGRDPSEPFKAEVTAITKYEPGPNALRRYLEGETLDRALPGVESVEAGEAICLAFPGWTQEVVDEHGMLGFQLRVLSAPS